MPFLFLFISLNKDTNFLMNFNVDIPPYITRMSSGLEDRTRKQQTRSPSEDILVFSCIKYKIPGSNPYRPKSFLFSTSSRPAAVPTRPPI